MNQEIIVWIIITTVIVLSARSLYKTLTERETSGCGGSCGGCSGESTCTSILTKPPEQ